MHRCRRGHGDSPFKCSMQWLILNLEAIQLKRISHHHYNHKKTITWNYYKKKVVLEMFLLNHVSVWVWTLNIEQKLLYFFLGMFWPLTPWNGDLLPKGKLCRMLVLNVRHHVALKHGFAWLRLAVRSSHSVYVHFGLTWAPQCLACNDCLCYYKPVIQIVSTSHLFVSVYSGCWYYLWGGWNVSVGYIMWIKPLSS